MKPSAFLEFVFLLLFAALPIGCQSDSETASTAPESTASTGLRPNERILFFGDSITAAGVEPGGYVTLVADSLARAHPDLNIQVIGAGIGGNKVPDLLARVNRDVLAQNPTTVVVYIGINDVWHWDTFNNGTTDTDFDAGLRALVDTLRAADARVLLCTPSVIGEKPDGQNPQDSLLNAYSDITRRVAADKGVRVCDLRAAFTDYLRTHNTTGQEQGLLTTDRVHLNEAGNRFVAERMLEALEG